MTPSDTTFFCFYAIVTIIIGSIFLIFVLSLLIDYISSLAPGNTFVN